MEHFSHTQQVSHWLLASVTNARCMLRNWQQEERGTGKGDRGRGSKKGHRERGSGKRDRGRGLEKGHRERGPGKRDRGRGSEKGHRERGSGKRDRERGTGQGASEKEMPFKMSWRDMEKG